MSNIKERLRAFPPGDGEGALFHEALAEIERLEAALNTCRDLLWVYGKAEIDRLRAEAEVERLRAENLILSVMGTSANENR